MVADSPDADYLRRVAEVKLRLIPDPTPEGEAAPRSSAAVNPYTSMTERFGRTAKLFGRRFFGEFDFERHDAERLSDLDRAGAVVYVLRRPDPVPEVFGYHEVFHALVIAAVALQYAAVAIVVTG